MFKYFCQNSVDMGMNLEKNLVGKVCDSLCYVCQYIWMYVCNVFM